MPTLFQTKWLSISPAIHKIRQENGGLALAFAIMLPFIFACCALAFDGSRILTKKARLADVLNEAALAVAASEASNADTLNMEKLNALVDDYIQVHLPNENIIDRKINIEKITVAGVAQPMTVFDVSARIKVDTMLPFESVPAFSAEVELGSRGKATKAAVNFTEADYVIVVDVSSMRELYRDNNWGGKYKDTPQFLDIKKIVEQLTTDVLKRSPKSTFTIVPFSIGVPVSYPISGPTEGKFYPRLNQLGGENSGCSMLMVPKTEYKINYAFWSDKRKTNGYYYNTATTAGLKKAMDVLDEGRYYYFSEQVLATLIRTKNLRYPNGRANIWKAWQTMAVGHKYSDPDKQWCTQHHMVDPDDNRASDDAYYNPTPFGGGRYDPERGFIMENILPPYSCEKPPEYTFEQDMSIYHPDNQQIIKDEYTKATMFVLPSAALGKREGCTAPSFECPIAGSGGFRGSIFHNDSVDVDATIASIFQSNSIINLPLFRSIGTGAQVRYYAPFFSMCAASGWNREFYEGEGNGISELDKSKQHTFLIEATNDLTKLKAFQSMKRAGPRVVVSGVLRAAPELIKGPNRRKIMIIISLTREADDVKYMADKFHNKDLCGNIRRQAMAADPKIDAVDIYFISLDHKDEVKHSFNQWQKCTGKDKMFYLENFEQTMRRLQEVIPSMPSEETGNFYN